MFNISSEKYCFYINPPQQSRFSDPENKQPSFRAEAKNIVHHLKEQKYLGAYNLILKVLFDCLNILKTHLPSIYHLIFP